MDAFLVTPASEAESQLLAALFRQMRVKAEVVSAPPAPRRRAKKSAPKTGFVPQTPAEAQMREAVLELKEVLAGRQQALTLDEFWQEVRED